MSAVVRPDRDTVVEVVRLANIALADIGMEGVVLLHEHATHCSPRWRSVYGREANRACALAVERVLGPDFHVRCSAHQSVARRQKCATVAVRDVLRGRLCELAS